MLRVNEQDRQTLIDPLYRMGRGFYLLAGGLLLIIAWGAVVWVRQFLEGLGVTGMQRPVYWGVYMVNFIFFIGISHAGTLISAILRVSQAEWRRPITRIAEAITVFALMVGTLQIFLDMGRPDRLLNVFVYGRLQSPLLWDAVSVTMYFLGSVTYLFLPLLPDIALLRDNLPAHAPAWRKPLYTFLSLGWRGTREQWRRLEKAIGAMAILIIPIAVSVHTIISWILATTVQPGWHSTIFGPYFVVGAIFSGIGALFIAMSAMRHVLHLETYITARQYRNLGAIFILMTAVWFYFTYAEHLTLAAGQQEAEFPVLAAKLWGQFAPSFWTMVAVMILAFWVLVFPRLLPASWSLRLASARVLPPRSALAMAGVAAVLLVFLFVPSVSPFNQPMVALTDTWVNRVMLLGLALGLLVVSGIRLLPWLKEHWVASSLIAASAVVIGMWLERWNLVIPTLTRPRLVPYAEYAPTWTEWSLTAASFALFAFLFLVFFKLFPAVSIWEVTEGRVIDEARGKIEIPSPEPSASERLRWGVQRLKR